MKKLNVIISILFLFLNTEFSFPQSDPDQICGSEFNYGGEDIDSLFGGRFKPHRTDIGGSPENEGKFPVLIFRRCWCSKKLPEPSQILIL